MGMLSDLQVLKSKILQLPDDEFMPSAEAVQAVSENITKLIEQGQPYDFNSTSELRNFFQVDEVKRRTGTTYYDIVADHRTDRDDIAGYVAYYLNKYENAETEKSQRMIKGRLKHLGYSSNLDENLAKVFSIRDKTLQLSETPSVKTSASNKAVSETDINVTPKKEVPVATASASTPPNRQERIANPTNKDDVLPKAPKAKQADKAKAAAPIRTDAPKAPVQEPPQEPVIGTPFLSHGFNFLLLKPSEAFLRPDRKAIIDGYLFEDTVSFFFGPASSYKTFWLLWEAIHIATGKEFCGMKINGGARRILFITLEMTAKDITNRMYRMTANWTAEEKKLLDENFILLSSEDESRIRATSTNILDALMEMCDQNNIGGIYLDAYTEYIVGLDVRSESQGDVINAMRQKANKHHVYFRVIHHSTKTTKTKDGDIDGSMAGIHTIRDTADQVYAVKLLNENLEIRITNDPTKDNSTKPRFGKAITFTVKFISDEERGSFSFARLENNETSSYIEKYSNLLSAIEEEPGIPKGKLRDKLGNPKDLTKMIQNAVDAGDIIVDSKKSDKGQTQQCLYRSEYWNNTH